MGKREARGTVTRSELLDEDQGDGRFRQLLYDVFAFAEGLAQARALFAGSIGLSAPQYLILIVVDQAEASAEIGVAQVAERLHLSGAFVTIEANKLVQAGLLEKHPHSVDRRRVHLTVTANARDLLTQLALVQRPVNDALFAGLSREEFEHLGATMHRLAQGAGQAIHLAHHLIAREGGAHAEAKTGRG